MLNLRRQRRTVTGLAFAVIAMLVAASCGSSDNTNSTSNSTNGSGGGSNLSGTLNGSGSTFQLSYQQVAIESFKSVQPKMTVNYGGGGSGKGRTDLASGVVQYAGSDSPISEKDLPNYKGKTVLYFPVLIGPIAITYNLSGVDNLKLDGPTIAKIFEAKVTKWNAPEIASQNSGVSLPDKPIVIARRSDSSGTTQNFSKFLVESAPGVWTLGTSSTISWPPDSRGGNGNGGVAQIVKSTDGAIGYVDYSDAKATQLSMASVKNKAGNYVAPSTDSASAAAEGAEIKPDLTFSAIWAPGAQAYPITYQSWVLVYEKQSDANVASMLQAYVGYLIGDGQKLLPQLGYAPLPSSLQQKAQAQLSKISSS